MIPRLGRQIFYQTLKIGYPLTPKIFLGVVGSQFDKYLIGLLATLGGVGIYSIGQRIAMVIFNTMAAIYNALQPQVFRKMFESGERGGAEIGRYLLPFAYASTAFALLLALFSEEIIFILTPVSYHGAMEIVIVLSMYYGILFFSMHPQLLYAKKTFVSSILSMVSIGLNILINIPFIMKWGAIGAAWGTLLAGLVSGSLSFGISQHYYEIKWNYRKIGTIFGLFIIAALTILLLRHANVPYPWRLFHKGICLLAYLYLGVRLRVITLENLSLLRNAVPWVRAVPTCEDR
jgi:O-antigen/teichoic acid export membrane protein